MNDRVRGHLQGLQGSETSRPGLPRNWEVPWGLREEGKGDGESFPGMEVQGGSLARVGENKAGGRSIRGEGKGEMGAEGGGGRGGERISAPQVIPVPQLPACRSHSIVFAERPH